MIEDTIKIQSFNDASRKEIKHNSNTDYIKKKTESTDENKDVKKYQDKSVKEAVEQIDNAAKYFNSKIRIEVEHDLNIVVIKVIDGDTDKVIRQIPSEEIVELSKKAKDLKGLLINKEG